jgi:predicted aldo/keto reductase-like oxidoreductase
MKRRTFLQATMAAAAAARGLAASRPIPKRIYRQGVEISVIAFGGMLLVGTEQKAANSLVAEAIDRGLNYFDVAPSYGNGEAEEKMGPALKPHRNKAFLACKTLSRDAEGAQAVLERSLTRLKTDHFDLYQFHSVKTLEEVNQILAPGGAAEVLLKARKEGKVRFLGFSAHGAEAALALMDRFPFDSVLFPVNYVCYAEGNFGPQILALAKEKGMARLALKALAYSRWPQGLPASERKYPKCWYQPVDEPERARLALRFTLSQEVTAAVPPGDERLFRLALDFAAEFQPLSAAEQGELLASAQGVTPIFRA